MTLLTLLKGAAVSNKVGLTGSSLGESGGLADVGVYRSALGAEIWGTTLATAEAIIVLPIGVTLKPASAGDVVVGMPRLAAAQMGVKASLAVGLLPASCGIAVQSPVRLAPPAAGCAGSVSSLGPATTGVRGTNQASMRAPVSSGVSSSASLAGGAGLAAATAGSRGS